MASSDGAQASMESEITTLDTKKEETLASTEAQRVSESQMSVESSAGANAEVSSPLVEAEGSGQTLENATELMEKGSLALKEGDYAEAVDCFSRAVEIRAGHYGELAPECSAAYYKYGCALLYKAQEETDPLGSVPKKEGSSEENSAKHGAVTKPEFSASSVGCDAKKDTDSGDGKKDQIEAEEADGDDEEASEGDDVAEQDDDDESDLDLAWKMLDIARAIIEKNPEDTMEKVDVLSALGEVALEREDIDTSFNDYAKALSILERLVEPDSRHIAELNFRLSLVLELGSKPVDAMPYCKKAISVCECRVQRLTDEVKSSTVSTAIVDSTNTEADQPPGGSETISVTSKEAEIKTLTDLSIDLEKKLEDLQQLVLNPTSMLPEVLKMISAQASGNGKNVASSNLNSSQMATSSGGSNSTTFSTAHTNGNSDAPVVNLGVVGRGVKRATPSSISAEAGASKKPLADKGVDWHISPILVMLKFAEHLKEAVTYIEQGHVRIGPDTVTDPAFPVTRNMEDFVTLVDSSKIRQTVLIYNETFGDYEAMNW